MMPGKTAKRKYPDRATSRIGQRDIGYRPQRSSGSYFRHSAIVALLSKSFAEEAKTPGHLFRSDSTQPYEQCRT